MLFKIKVLVSLTIILLVSVALFSQEAKEAAIDSTAVVKERAVSFLSLLRDNNIEAADYVIWDYFTLNGIDYSDDYESAIENEEEDRFLQDKIDGMHKLLSFEVGTADVLVDWKITRVERSSTVTCHNKKKNVVMKVFISSLGEAYIEEVAITDRVNK